MTCPRTLSWDLRGGPGPGTCLTSNLVLPLHMGRGSDPVGEAPKAPSDPRGPWLRVKLDQSSCGQGKASAVPFVPMSHSEGVCLPCEGRRDAYRPSGDSALPFTKAGPQEVLPLSEPQCLSENDTLQGALQHGHPAFLLRVVSPWARGAQWEARACLRQNQDRADPEDSTHSVGPGAEECTGLWDPWVEETGQGPYVLFSLSTQSLPH